MKPPDNVKHLKLQLGKTIESTVEVTLAQTEPKLVKRRILATTPPMDVLHRAALINTASVPVYNHASMALFAEILQFLWTKKVVVKKRLSTGLEEGGLGIPYPDKTNKGFQQNLLQKMYRQGRLQPLAFLPAILAYETEPTDPCLRITFNDSDQSNGG
jgi:hypothetical protein